MRADTSGTKTDRVDRPDAIGQLSERVPELDCLVEDQRQSADHIFEGLLRREGDSDSAHTKPGQRSRRIYAEIAEPD